MGTKINEDYKYELKYIDEDKRITHEFNADIDVTGMAENLRDFLCGCSWSEKQANNIVGFMGEDE